MFYVTYTFLTITVLISYQGFKNPELIRLYSFNPYVMKEKGQSYRFITHAFLHADSTHLLFNMMSLFFVGRYLEAVLVNYYGLITGEIHFLMIYFGGAVVGTVSSYIKNKDNPSYQSIGASGAVSAAIFGFIIWMPNVEFYLFFAIPMKAFVFGFLFLGFEFFAMKRSTGRIAHDVHLISALYGVVYILFINFEKGIELLDLILRLNG